VEGELLEFVEEVKDSLELSDSRLPPEKFKGSKSSKFLRESKSKGLSFCEFTRKKFCSITWTPSPVTVCILDSD